MTALGDSFTFVLNQENKMSFLKLIDRQKETVVPFKIAGSTVPAMALGAIGQRDRDVLGVMGEGQEIELYQRVWKVFISWIVWKHHILYCLLGRGRHALAMLILIITVSGSFWHKVRK